MEMYRALGDHDTAMALSVRRYVESIKSDLEWLTRLRARRKKMEQELIAYLRKLEELENTEERIQRAVKSSIAKAFREQEGQE